MQASLYSATGNVLWVIEEPDLSASNFIEYAEVAQRLCAGRCADGLMLLNSKTCELWIINADGTDGGFCGNGVRAVTYHLARTQAIKSMRLTMGGHDIEAQVSGEQITLRLQNPNSVIESKLLEDSMQGYFIKVPNPHLVILNPPQHWKIAEEGGRLCQRLNTNVEFVYPADELFPVAVYERGVGVTQACGSGCIAVFKILQHLGLIENAIQIKMPGGILSVTQERDLLFFSGAVRFLKIENLSCI